MWSLTDSTKASASGCTHAIHTSRFFFSLLSSRRSCLPDFMDGYPPAFVLAGEHEKVSTSGPYWFTSYASFFFFFFSFVFFLFSSRPTHSTVSPFAILFSPLVHFVLGKKIIFFLSVDNLEHTRHFHRQKHSFIFPFLSVDNLEHTRLFHGKRRARADISDPEDDLVLSGCVSLCLCGWVWVGVGGCRWVCVRVCVCACVGVRACACVFLCEYMCVCRSENVVSPDA